MSNGSKNTIDRLVKEFYEMFPHSPNPETEPNKFAYYVKLYKYLYNIDKLPSEKDT